MSNTIFRTVIRFIALVLLQGIILHNVDVNIYIHPMIYPLFIILLPLEINFYLSLILAFTLGISVDIFSSTFGLNASAAVFLAYIRPMILKLIQPRDGYENISEPNIHQMGRLWFLYFAGIMVGLHHFWFFLLEQFNLLDILTILLKTLLSGVISLIIMIISQYLIVNREKKVA